MDLGPDFRDFRSYLKGFKPYSRAFSSDFKVLKPNFRDYSRIQGLQGFQAVFQGPKVGFQDNSTLYFRSSWPWPPESMGYHVK